MIVTIVRLFIHVAALRSGRELEEYLESSMRKSLLGEVLIETEVRAYVALNLTDLILTYNPIIFVYLASRFYPRNQYEGYIVYRIPHLLR